MNENSDVSKCKPVYSVKGLHLPTGMYYCVLQYHVECTSNSSSQVYTLLINLNMTIFSFRKSQASEEGYIMFFEVD